MANSTLSDQIKYVYTPLFNQLKTTTKAHACTSKEDLYCYLYTHMGGVYSMMCNQHGENKTRTALLEAGFYQ